MRCDNRTGMNLNLRMVWLNTLKKAGGTIIEDASWKKPEDYTEVDIGRFTEDDLTKLEAILEPENEKKTDGARAALLKIRMFRKIKADPAGAKITRLEGLVEAMRAYIGTSEHKWLFGEEEDGQTVAFYVHRIQYSPPDSSNGNPASTTLTMSAVCGRIKADKSITWHTDDLGRTCVELLSAEGFVLERPELVEQYEKECKRYAQISDLTGEQFNATGMAFPALDYYSRGTLSMEVDSLPTRVVMDDVESSISDDDERTRNRRESRSVVVSASLWQGGQKKRFSETEEDAVASLPLQPYVTVFDLMKHRFLKIHVNNLTEYVYDKELIDKLVLEKDKKDLVSILMAGADVKLDDIVKGKTGGIIVVCTGPPGTGKTLTAEVFSEEMRRPLYGVQCSQLGTSEEDLEKQLKTVLGRAARWKAILLIDEADVYVHARGEDIQQNAIVGVFLRMLEYYRGVLFMTSNRETVIDDAILSRATAWIQYSYPDAERLKRIWTVLSAQYSVGLMPAEVEALARHPKLGKQVSGRTVKNLLKLARLLTAKNKQRVDIKLFEYVSQFLDMDGQNRKREVSANTCACDCLPCQSCDHR